LDQKRLPEGWDKERALTEGVELHVRRVGSGHPLLLLHGGMGSWTHWRRNIDVLAEHFEVRAIDAPSHGDSDPVDYDLDHVDYLDIAEASIRRIVKDDESFSIAGFSFGAAIGGAMAVRFSDRLRAISVVGPGGFSKKGRPQLPFMSYKAARGKPDLMRRTLKNNLMALMVTREECITDQVLDDQDANVERARFDSRKVSGQPSLAIDLGKAGRPAQLIYGEHDVTAFPSIEDRAGMIREHLPDLNLHVLKNAGHWVMHEAADEVNRLIIDFHGKD